MTYRFSRIISEKGKIKDKTTVNELILLASLKITIFFTCKIKTGIFLFHNEESETGNFYIVSFSINFEQVTSRRWNNTFS